ncbi:MAG: short-chain dehydrogenase/reductase, partial [Rhizobacter sp.]|nr:short-chain dehydrogenase/reductase [Rhizobacter sp.]
MTTPDTRPVAMVTGGARGIGLAIGQWFLAHGHRVALVDIDEATLERTVATLGRPDDVIAVHADVSKPDSVKAAVATITRRFGRIDKLVNNAGVAVFKPALETSFEEYRHVMSVNLDGAFLCTQACAPVMLANGGGAIVNI